MPFQHGPQDQAQNDQKGNPDPLHGHAVTGIGRLIFVFVARHGYSMGAVSNTPALQADRQERGDSVKIIRLARAGRQNNRREMSDIHPGQNAASRPGCPPRFGLAIPAERVKRRATAHTGAPALHRLERGDPLFRFRMGREQL